MGLIAWRVAEQCPLLTLNTLTPSHPIPIPDSILGPILGLMEVVFLAVGYKEAYENLLCVYAACVLETVPNAGVEMVVLDAEKFKTRFAAGLGVLEKYHPGRILVRGQSFPERVSPNAARFYEVPQLRAPYTYIGDVDIFITDPHLLGIHKAIMASTGLPYSNRVRGSGVKLTGLHCVRTDDYYTDALRALQAQLRSTLPGSAMDEVILLRMCKEVFGVTPNRQRPIHGVHVSFRRKCNQIKPGCFKKFVALVRRSDLIKELALACPHSRTTIKRVGVEMDRAFNAGWQPHARSRVEGDLVFLREDL